VLRCEVKMLLHHVTDAVEVAGAKRESFILIARTARRCFLKRVSVILVFVSVKDDVMVCVW